MCLPPPGFSRRMHHFPCFSLRRRGKRKVIWTDHFRPSPPANVFWARKAFGVLQDDLWGGGVGVSPQAAPGGVDGVAEASSQVGGGVPGGGQPNRGAPGCLAIRCGARCNPAGEMRIEWRHGEVLGPDPTLTAEALAWGNGPPLPPARCSWFDWAILGALDVQGKVQPDCPDSKLKEYVKRVGCSQE